VGKITRVLSNRPRLAWFVCCCVTLVSSNASALTIGNMASSVTNSFEAIGKMLTGVSYVAGVGLMLAGLSKLKAHKDSPTQVPVSNGLVLMAIAAFLIFLPSVVGTLSFTLFGAAGGSIAGPGGVTLGS